MSSEAVAAPDRTARQACWDSRDAYFACLTANNEEQGKCIKEKAGFEKNCAASWASYFIQRRALQKRQDLTYAMDSGNIAKAAAEKEKAAQQQRS